MPDGVSNKNEPKLPRKNYNKVIKILGLIVLIPITGMALDFFLNVPDWKETRYALTENCWTDITIKTETGKITRLAFECNTNADVEEVRDAMGGLREKANELDYKINMPYTAEGLHNNFQNPLLPSEDNT